MPIDTALLGYSSSLTIEETIGAGPGAKPRKLTLTGSGLPFMGAEWAFENQVITTWYPGNSVEATQQNLGPRELPSTWQGDWRRTLLGRMPAKYIDERGASHDLIEPHVLREVMEAIGRSRIRLRVTWSVDATTAVGSVLGTGVVRDDVPKIVREGLIKSARFPHTRHTDIQWTIEFHWASRGGKQDRVVSSRQDDDLLAASNSLNASAAATRAAVDRIRKDGKKLTLGKLEQLFRAPFLAVQNFITDVEQGVSRLRELGMIASRALALPAETFRGVERAASSVGQLLGASGTRQQPRDVSKAMSNEARAILVLSIAHQNEAGRLPAEVVTSRQTVTAVLRAQTYYASISDRAIVNARVSQEFIERLRQPTFQRGNAGVISVHESQTTRAGDLIAVHIVKAGDTPQRLSVLYYSSPDHAADILSANKLPLHQAILVPGSPIIIPTLANRPNVAS